MYFIFIYELISKLNNYVADNAKNNYQIV